LQITDKFKARSLIKEKEENRKQTFSTLFTKYKAERNENRGHFDYFVSYCRNVDLANT